jgi:transcriptional regulator with XRE-family HTH domain
MIKNDRQYRITKAQAEKFEHALAQLQDSSSVDVDIHPLIRKAQADAARSQLEELRSELAEYESLRAGIHEFPALQAFNDLPKFLIQARIARGLSQRELAERLGLKMQQIQRYEATEYEGASFARIKEVIQALQLDAKAADVNAVPALSVRALQKRLTELGLEPGFIRARLMPWRLVAEVESAAESSGALIAEMAELAARALQIPIESLLGPTSPTLSLSPAFAGVRFKMPARVDEQRLTAYTIYAQFLAELLLQATTSPRQTTLPTDARAFRQTLTRNGAVDFEGILHTIWDLGVPILPLRDHGAFHGACWRVAGRNVIVLKQMTRTVARWSFDALHEFWHVGQEPERDSLATIEFDEDVDRLRTPEEINASLFAGSVLLGDDADKLAHKVAARAGSDIRRLKTVVPAIASQEGVPVGVLANYMAFRLSLENENWWPTAATLQAGGPDPWAIARNVLLERVDFGRLGHVDRKLLAQALAGSDEDV